MKKFVSALILLSMIMSIICVSVSADEGTIYLEEDFSSEEVFYSRFHAGNFYIDEGLLYGYGAKTFMSFYDDSEESIFKDHPTCWMTYDMEVIMSIAEDEFSDVDNRHVCLSYCNDNLFFEGRVEGRMFYNFGYSVPNKEFYLTAGAVGSYSEEDFITLAVPYELPTDGEDFFTLGMSVSEGRLRCFYNGELIIDFVDARNEHLISHKIPSPFLLWNTNNFIQIKNVKIASDGYLYPYETETETTVTTEAPATEDNTEDTEETVVDATEATEGTDDSTIEATEGEDTDAPADSTNSPADNTDAPEADTVGTTGTQKPSTSTGDASFVVVAAMVAALGSALIVRKVRG